jgi:Trk-type K+ transport system membrane component
MNKKILRNIAWIALLTVWGFWAGAYFNLGWNRDHSVNHAMGFIMGGVAMLIVLLGFGLLARKIAKKRASADPSQVGLITASIITSYFLVLALIKYNDVHKDKFIEDFEYSFIDYYSRKASDMSIEIEDIDGELFTMYYFIQSDLRKHSALDEMLEYKTQNELFESNTIVNELCMDYLDNYAVSDNSELEKLKALFED